jgi:hypothetical protein
VQSPDRHTEIARGTLKVGDRNDRAVRIPREGRL